MKLKRRQKSLKPTEAKMDALPAEVLTEILGRLPVKTLLQCLSVCKSWYALIKNPNFISIHLHITLSSNNNPLFFHLYRNQYWLRFDDKDLGLGEYMPLNPPINVSLSVAGSCNGLVCLFETNYTSYRLILWNPSIRKSLLLPKSPCLPVKNALLGRKIIGFGFDSRTNDYKVLKIRRLAYGVDNCIQAKLYSLNANSWKIITNITPKYDYLGNFRCPAFVNGALHWIESVKISSFHYNYLILVFDMRDEVFREIFLPECLVNVASWRLKVVVFGNSSLAVIHRNDCFESHIWVMKEYGVVASWVKVGTVGRRWRGCSDVIGFRNNGEVLMEFGVNRARIASLNLEHGRVNQLIALKKAGVSKFLNYMESLLLLDKPGNEASGSIISETSN